MDLVRRGVGEEMGGPRCSYAAIVFLSLISLALSLFLSLFAPTPIYLSHVLITVCVNMQVLLMLLLRLLMVPRVLRSVLQLLLLRATLLCCRVCRCCDCSWCGCCACRCCGCCGRCCYCCRTTASHASDDHVSSAVVVDIAAGGVIDARAVVSGIAIAVLDVVAVALAYEAVVADV